MTRRSVAALLAIAWPWPARRREAGQRAAGFGRRGRHRLSSVKTPRQTAGHYLVFDRWTEILRCAEQQVWS